LAENMEVGIYQSKWLFNVLLHKCFYMITWSTLLKWNCKLMDKKSSKNIR